MGLSIEQRYVDKIRVIIRSPKHKRFSQLGATIRYTTTIMVALWTRRSNEQTTYSLLLSTTYFLPKSLTNTALNDSGAFPVNSAT